jgi:glycerophosphoryl diester phosphodiesterase
MHDDTVDRTTNGTGAVSELTYAEISELRLVDVDGQVLDEGVPTFADALSFLDGRGFAQVDLKDTSFEEISETLVAANAVDRSVVITYSIEDAIRLAGLLPEVTLSVGARNADDLERLNQGGVDFSLTTIWLGVGTGNPDWDAVLANLGLETSFGDFGGERNGTVDYQLLSQNGAEVISVDDVPAAAAALDAYDSSRALLEACPAAQG